MEAGSGEISVFMGVNKKGEMLNLISSAPREGAFPKEILSRMLVSIRTVLLKKKVNTLLPSMLLYSTLLMRNN